MQEGDRLITITATLAPASARVCRARIERASDDISMVVSACLVVDGAAPHNVDSRQVLRFGSTRSFSRIGSGPSRNDLSCQPLGRRSGYLIRRILKVRPADRVKRAELRCVFNISA